MRFIFLIFLLSFISCGSSQEEKVASSIDRAQTYLSKGKCDEALKELNEARDLENAIYLQVLASAYACKGDVEIVNVIAEIKNIDTNKGVFVPDNKSLLNDYITIEELWACTTCNACVEECPVNISPLSIIMDMRRYLVMEQSAAPMSLNAMMTNIENNGAPWQYNQMDRLNWKDEN